MRKDIYFKDDDSRLSFLSGNYITLTNLSTADIDRIILMKLPVNVSLHTMNPDLRSMMMGNPAAGERIEDLKRIIAAGNTVNIQLVLCPGINDGKELLFTLEELFKLNCTAIGGISLVPVGLTKFREHLYPLTPFDKDGCKAVIETEKAFQQKFFEKTGRNVVYASDEFFLKAELPIPPAKYYDDYPQFENGVGFVRAFADEFLSELRKNIRRKVNSPEPYIIVTGEGMGKTMARLIDYAGEFVSVNVAVLPVKNEFYGGGVNVTGLLTGTDIVKAMWDVNVEKNVTVLLCEDMFKSGTDLFLDDLTIADVAEMVGLRCEKIPRDGSLLFRKITGLI